MLVFPDMLVPAAKEAGMSVPNDADDFDKNEFPHFAVFCNIQLGSPLPSPTAHWENAKVIAAISDDDIRTIDVAYLINAGVSIGYVAP